MSDLAGAPIDQQAIQAIKRHPAVRRARLVGSRATGTATAVSDWDFKVETDDFQAVARDVGPLFATLRPLAQQWDRLSETQCWVVILAGPVKLDFIFDEPHEAEPPWEPDPSNLVAVDRHLWDWVLWLCSKQMKGRHELVAGELRKMFDHLLRPMGVEISPASLDAAVATYLVARERREHEFGVEVSRRLEREVTKVLRDNSEADRH